MPRINRDTNDRLKIDKKRGLVPIGRGLVPIGRGLVPIGREACPN